MWRSLTLALGEHAQAGGALPKQPERQIVAALLRGDVRRALQVRSLSILDNHNVKVSEE